MALDDFGTGYFSLNYLSVFPFNGIKIDKSFTQGVRNRRECRAAVASAVALAQGLGIATTAEGGETEERLEYMREIGGPGAELSIWTRRPDFSARPA